MDRYRYAPLEKDCIQLLRIKRSTDRAIQGTLPHHRLSDSLTFVALSYYWGPPTPAHEIIISGRPFSVRDNLYMGLQQLVTDKFNEFIWIDAICINQDDRSEKQHQIPLMGRIFAGAFYVLAWLGPASAQEEECFRALVFEPTIRASVSEEVKASLFPPLPDWKLFYSTVGRIFQRPWFQRLWVVQEVCLAKHIELLCGSA
ncbi:hypothetical protein H2203_001604 [Taxawa tesnikishii (nom. ined.)]|nr:hypothetical protein H2203_001604 [Dothideales sp. JES 119]